jgi:hypothetical protein
MLFRFPLQRMLAAIRRDHRANLAAALQESRSGSLVLGGSSGKPETSWPSKREEIRSDRVIDRERDAALPGSEIGCR